MITFREAREALLFAYLDGSIDDTEFAMLYDLNLNGKCTVCIYIHPSIIVHTVRRNVLLQTHYFHSLGNTCWVMQPRGAPPCWIDSYSTLRANVTWASQPKWFCFGEMYFAVNKNDFAAVKCILPWVKMILPQVRMILPWWNWSCRQWQLWATVRFTLWIKQFSRVFFIYI